MQTYFTSDLHLLHKNIPKYRSVINSTQENDEFMLHKLSLLGKRDLLWVLGDFIFDSPNYDKIISQIKSMPFQLKLVMGNHDSRQLYHSFTEQIQLPLISYKNKWISHCPVHPDEMRFRDGNIHGHLHSGTLNDERYFNVNIDVNNFEFVPLELINQHFNKDI